MKKNSYHEQQKIESIQKLRELEKRLPPFVAEYMRNARRINSMKTKVAYAYDLKIFFTFLCENCTAFLGREPEELTLSDLETVTANDVDAFLSYVSYYENMDTQKEYLNDESAKARKLSAIRSLYAYFYKKQKIAINPTNFVDAPKIPEKNITRLEVHEVARLLDHIEEGDGLTEKQKQYHDITEVRDLALVTMLLGTGMRVSECVGIDLDDIDFEQNAVRIVRKGGNESIIYFGEEVQNALADYLEVRKKIKGIDENALFLSTQKRRINVRTVQNLVKKYASHVTVLKNISPHKLRSTYGTNLYNETGDIYLVADALGHKDVNTTKKHYAQIDNERRRLAAKAVKLRD